MSVYATRYSAFWGSLKGVAGKLYIDEAYYQGDVTTLKIRGGNKNAIQITQHWNGWDSHILGTTLGFDIVNDFDDFYTLMPLMQNSGVRRRVRLVKLNPDDTESLLFQGFLDISPTSQKMLNRQFLHLTASTNLSKLKYWHTPMIDKKQNVRFINLVDSILRKIDYFNIRVNSSLCDNDTLTPGHTLFDLNGINTELFWEDNVNRKNNEEILNTILKTFNCYIYWSDGYWYIERFNDLWKEQVTYVEYQTGIIYDGYQTGTQVNVSRSIRDLHDFTFLRQSQTIRINPAVSKVEVKVNTSAHLLLNLVDTNFEVDKIPDVESNDLPMPENREWVKYGAFTWLDTPSFNDIEKGIWRMGVGCDGDTDDYGRGIWTGFRCFVNDEDSVISLQWKYGPQALASGSSSSAPLANVRWSQELLEARSFDFHWSLRQRYTDNKYFIKNESTGEYELVTIDPNNNQFYNTIHVEGKDFDYKNGTYTISVSINIGKLGSEFIGTIQDLVFGIGLTEVYDENGIVITPTWSESEIYGDVLITTNSPIENIDNFFRGIINSELLTSKKYELDIADIDNINYTNGVLTGDQLSERTSIWNDGSSEWYDLVSWFIRDKFKLYYNARQRISAEVQVPGKGILWLNLFDLFNDSKQGNKHFILTEYNYFPIFNIYSIVLEEFDLETIVSILESEVTQ